MRQFISFKIDYLLFYLTIFRFSATFKCGCIAARVRGSIIKGLENSSAQLIDALLDLTGIQKRRDVVYGIPLIHQGKFQLTDNDPIELGFYFHTCSAKAVVNHPQTFPLFDVRTNAFKCSKEPAGRGSDPLTVPGNKRFASLGLFFFGSIPMALMTDRHPGRPI